MTDTTTGLLSRGSQVRILPGAPFPKESAGSTPPGSTPEHSGQVRPVTSRESLEAVPDVICLVQTDAWGAREVDPLRKEYTSVMRHPLENHYGMLLYSRLPITGCEVRSLVSPDVPSMGATIPLRSGDEVVIQAVNPHTTPAAEPEPRTRCRIGSDGPGDPRPRAAVHHHRRIKRRRLALHDATIPAARPHGRPACGTRDVQHVVEQLRGVGPPLS